MKTFLFSLLFVSVSLLAQAQTAKNFKEYSAVPSSYDQIKVIPVFTDEHGSAYIIFVKEEVKLHKHVKHSEYVVILEGKGSMLLGAEEIKVKKGDFIVIPKGTPHSVQVKGKKPLKVLSIQTPEFKGKDRIMID